MPTRAYCLCCDAERRWVWHTWLPRFLFGTAATIQHCRTCGFGRTVPPPRPEETYYEVNVRYDSLFQERLELYRGFAQTLLATLDGVVEPAGGTRLLDVGCGSGALVEAAQEAGFTAEGVEANGNMVEWCRERNLRVTRGNALDVRARTDGVYDVVVLSAILEHVRDPVALLRACTACLAPGGHLLISQATFDGLLPRVFPWGWYGWQPREHYWHFTPTSFRGMAARADLETVDLVRRSLHHPWFARGSVSELVGRNLAAAIARIGHRFGGGDSLKIVLRPRAGASPTLPDTQEGVTWSRA